MNNGIYQTQQAPHSLYHHHQSSGLYATIPHPAKKDTQIIVLSDDEDGVNNIAITNKNKSSTSSSDNNSTQSSSGSSGSSSSSSSSSSSKSSASSASSSGGTSIRTVTSEEYERDEKGYIRFIPGLIIDNKYKMIRQLGKGTFSRVFECHKVASININNSKRNKNKKKKRVEKYAVKIIRNVYKYQLAAQTELSVLRRITSQDPSNTSCCIHIIENSNFKGHPIFVFPLLGKSIYSFMVSNGYKPFCYNDVIDLMWQICRGVAYIHSLNIIITDLKPENIVLVNDKIDKNNPNIGLYSCPKSTKINLIDFGSAVVHSPTNNTHSHLIQTRHYRAPEVVFKLNWSFSADIWSIGCILVELIHGKMLFNTHCSIDHLNQMVKCIDAPPTQLLELIDDDTWNEYFDQRGALNMYKAKRSPVQCQKLSDYFTKDIHYNPDCANLYDLCKKMLCWNPNERISAAQALNHPIFYKYNNHNQ